jgi:hypothetical protein
VKQLPLWSGEGDPKQPRARAKRGEQSVVARKGAKKAATSAQLELSRRKVSAQSTPAVTMEQRYLQIERAMLAHYRVRVRKWRGSTSGLAWMVLYRDGTVSRLIESPKPRGPMSAAVFLHEIGHHAIGLGRFRPRCLEEYHAWAFSFWQMREQGLLISDRVRKRAADALRYAVDKAVRRGIKEIPDELVVLLMAARDQRLDEVERLLVNSGLEVAMHDAAAGGCPVSSLDQYGEQLDEE